MALLPLARLLSIPYIDSSDTLKEGLGARYADVGWLAYAQMASGLDVGALIITYDYFGGSLL